MTYRHGFVRLKSRARRQVPRKTWNRGERPGDGLMTAFLKFANLADVVLVRDSAAVQRRRIWRILRGFFSISFDHIARWFENLTFQRGQTHHLLRNPFSGDRSISR
jgi:hypothetical protein